MSNRENHIVQGWSRNLSFNEKLYTISESINGPCAIQFILKGEGDLAPKSLQHAIDLLGEKIPAVRLKRAKKQWQIKATAPLLKVHSANFPSALNNEFLKSNLSTDAPVEFHLFKGDNDTLLIRVLHAAMDGVGVLTMLQCLFKLLNKETIAPVTQHPIEETFLTQLTKGKPPVKREGYKFKWKGIINPNIKSTTEFEFNMVKTAHSISNLTGSIAKWYMDYVKEDARFLIPVNIRRYLPKVSSVANLSLPIYLQTQETNTAQDIQHNLLTDLHQNKELAKDPLAGFGKITPAGLLQTFLRKQITKAQRKNLFPMSGYISDLGFVDLETLQTATFKTIDLQPIPVHISLAPFCAFACHHQNGTRIGLSLPTNSNGTEITRQLQERLTTISTPPQTERIAKTVTENKNPRRKEIETIWSESLSLDLTELKEQSTFADLGGTSLQLILMLQHVEKQLPKDQRKTFFKKALKEGGSVTINFLLVLTNSLHNEN